MNKVTVNGVGVNRGKKASEFNTGDLLVIVGNDHCLDEFIGKVVIKHFDKVIYLEDGCYDSATEKQYYRKLGKGESVTLEVK